MPAKSKAQQKFFGMMLNKKRKGQPTGLGMTEPQIEDFAGTKTRGLPAKVAPKGFPPKKKKKMPASMNMGGRL
jgi:hypothetical protein